MKKRELYQSIARKYAPEGVTIVKTFNSESAGRSHFANDHSYPNVMEVLNPAPITVNQLWVFIHECMHFKLHSHLKLTMYDHMARLEAEVEIATMKVMDQEGVEIPLRALLARAGAFQWVARQFIQDDLVDQCLAEFKDRIAWARSSLELRSRKVKRTSGIEEAPTY